MKYNTCVNIRSTVPLFFLVIATVLRADEPLASAEALYRAVYEQNITAGTFDFTGRVNYVAQEGHVPSGTEMTLMVEDSGAIHLFGTAVDETANTAAGDIVHVRGRIIVNACGKCFPRYDHLAIVRHGKRPEPVDTSIARLLSGSRDFRLVRFRAVVRDASPSPTHPCWAVLGLVDDGHIIGAPVLIERCGFEAITPLVGKEVLITGCCTPSDLSSVYAGRQFHIYETNLIHVVEEHERRLHPAPLAGLGNLRPADYDRLGLHVARGTVVAVWNKNRVLLACPDDTPVFASLGRGYLPSLGDSIEVVGFPESNFYNINLKHARWTRTGDPAASDRDGSAASIPFAHLFERQWANLNPPNRRLTGRLIRTRGKILSLPASDGRSRLYLTDGTNSLGVETDNLTDAANGLAPGCEAEITGVCICEIEPYLQIQPTFRDIFLVPRDDADIRILSKPPWWTPARLLVAIAVLVALLVVIWLRNRLQKRTADLLAHATTDLRVAERTRLAVELHDSLAQNLTGVSMKIDAARRTPGAPARMIDELRIASRALLSCRAELRNCLWDLRHRTLELDDMESAVRQTLEPHLEDAELTIRFHVQRKRISDNTAHAVLCIIRELTINAVRHGRATAVKVAGSVERDKLLISVRDNGQGFDPAACPNDEQGHYGLLGIRERANAFEGSLDIDSRPGKGTKVTVILALPEDET